MFKCAPSPSLFPVAHALLSSRLPPMQLPTSSAWCARVCLCACVRARRSWGGLVCPCMRHFWGGCGVGKRERERELGVAGPCPPLPCRTTPQPYTPPTHALPHTTPLGRWSKWFAMPTPSASATETLSRWVGAEWVVTVNHTAADVADTVWPPSVVSISALLTGSLQENFMLSDRSDKARVKACDFGGCRGGCGDC